VPVTVSVPLEVAAEAVETIPNIATTNPTASVFFIFLSPFFELLAGRSDWEREKKYGGGEKISVSRSFCKNFSREDAKTRRTRGCAT
jgi:hypothetical protein